MAGHGSTFHFTLRTTAGALPAPTALPSLGGRFLIVDDNATNRFILQEQTRRWQMEPATAASGVAALALLDSGVAFDLAILDMHMPEMEWIGSWPPPSAAAPRPPACRWSC